MEKIKIGEVIKFLNDGHIEFPVVFRYKVPIVLKDFSVEIIQRMCNVYSRDNKYSCEEVEGIKYVLYSTKMSQGVIGDEFTKSRPAELSDVTAELELRHTKGQQVIDTWKLNVHDDLIDSLTGLALNEDGNWVTQ